MSIGTMTPVIMTSSSPTTMMVMVVMAPTTGATPPVTGSVTATVMLTVMLMVMPIGIPITITSAGRRRSGDFRCELQAERVHHLEHRAEARVSVLRQGLVETLARQTGVLREPHHAARTSDIAKRCGEERRIIFLEACL